MVNLKKEKWSKVPNNLIEESESLRLIIKKQGRLKCEYSLLRISQRLNKSNS